MPPATPSNYAARSSKGFHLSPVALNSIAAILLLGAYNSAFAQTDTFKPGDLVVVSADSAVLRVGKETMATLTKGETPRVTAVRAGWVGCVCTRDGTNPRGWLPAKALSPAPPAPVPEDGEAQDQPKTTRPRDPRPRRVWLDKIPEGIQLTDAYVSTEFEKGPEADWPTTFPSGTQELHFFMTFKEQPPDGTDLTIEFLGPDGKRVFIQSNGGVIHHYTPDAYAVELASGPKDGQPFPDGPCQAKFLLNDQSIALLNFTIGGD